MLWLTLCLIVISAIIFRMVKSLGYWNERNVVHRKSFFLLGSLKDSIIPKRNLGDMVRESYDSFQGKRYYGTHLFSVPCLFVTDADLIKRILVKDFDHFVDRTQIVDTEIEPLFSKNLTTLKGEKWRDMRNTLSPLFTGSKIRIMFRLITDCAEQLNDHFLDKEGELIEIEAKDVMSRVATDVIATIAFGIRCNSLKEDNDFYRMGTSLVQSNILAFFKFLVQMFLPKVAKKLGVRQVPKKMATFFEEVIRETLKQRQEKNIVRPDMIHIMMEARKVKNPPEEIHFPDIEDASTETTEIHTEQISIEDIVAQGFLFFLAGFEVVSMLLAHTCHELAVNGDVQERLQTEIDAAFEETKGDLDYDTLTKMKYLDMVISETLRKWPLAVLLNRECVRDYKIEGSEAHGEADLTVEKGVAIFIPVYGIHRDPKYYPDPDKFDPERFNEQNKPNINPYTYLPFGIGPRNCIGLRLALLEAKVLIAHLLRKFDVVVVEKTQVPLVLSPKKPSLGPDNFWLGLKKR